MDDIENESPYCPDCGACGEMGCCSFDCDKCRWSNGWFSNLDIPKTPVGLKRYFLDDDLEWKQICSD